MKSRALNRSGSVWLYFELSSFLLGCTVDDAVIAFMFGPITIEVWRVFFRRMRSPLHAVPEPKVPA